MIDENPRKRPSAQDLWAGFGNVSSEVCPDCDPRHPDVWKPSRPVDSKPQTSAHKSEDGPPSNDAGQDSGSSSDFTRLHTSEPSRSGSAAFTLEDTMPLDLERIDDLHSIPEYVELELLPSLSFGTSVSFLGTSEELDGAVKEIAMLLLKDEVLEPLYEMALKQLTTDRFERNFARLLRVFATDLKTEAQSHQEASVVRFVAARAKYVASCMGKLLDPIRTTHSQVLHDFLMESHEREERVELFLQRQFLDVDVADVDEIVDQKDLDGPEESEPDAADPAEQSPLQNLQDVRDFILNSVAFRAFRQTFHDLVIHGKVQNQQPADSGEQDLDISPPDVPTRPEEYSLDISDTEDSDNPQQVEDGETRPSISEGQPTLPSNILSALKHAWRGVAEYLELLERPIPSGFRRVRWTCFCGCSLYDDFREIETGSLNHLEGFLNSRTDVSRSMNGQSRSSHSSLPDSMGPTPGQSSSVQCSQKAPTGSLKTTDASLPPGLRRRQHRLEERNGSSASSSTWVLPLFQVERYGTKVKHLAVDTTTSDESLFTMVKAQYLGMTSRARRFLSMRGVKKISYVKFMHAPREPDIHKFDDWPLQKDSPPWVYKGCPAKRKHIPLVGHAYLMHLWQNPSHSDEQTYNNRPQSMISRLLHRTRLFKNYLAAYWKNEPDDPAVNRTVNDGQIELQQDVEMTRTNGPGDPTANTTAVSDNHGNRSSYVYLRTPKKLGDKLIPDDEDPPEAWGLYFEEGFAVHHFLVVILFIYILATIAFGAYWCTKYGLVGPRTGAGAFGISSWMIGLISLVVTVWFKWRTEVSFPPYSW
ncbi:MAG: hypothetical protein LQ350_004119 [Teloschistes chrysophthalmus]|nr:MAG: hypothetical protein LQ350_004119 [Niorma chrysophthalma]